jgi:hypothetical protein
MFEKLCRCTPKSAAKWEKNRAKGKSHFVWLYGVLGWGFPMFVFMTAFNYHRNPNSLALTLIINTIVWPIAGYGWGAWMWAINERAYKKYAEQKPIV